MKQKNFEDLRNENYSEAVEFISNVLVRNRNIYDNNLAYVVGASTVAYLMKEFNNLEETVLYFKKHLKDKTTLQFVESLVDKYSTQLETISKRYSGNELMAATLFSETSRYSAIGDNSTPDGISDLAIALLSLNEDDVVLDLCSGVSSFLLKAGMTTNNENNYGVEIGTENVIIANLRSLITKITTNVIQGNVISIDYGYLKANKVFSNCPLGLRYSMLEDDLRNNPRLMKYFKDAKRTVSGDWVFGLSSLINTQDNGRTVIMMTSAGTWNKPDEYIRKKLIESEKIEGVILLPSGLFVSIYTNLVMLIMSEGNKAIKMVDATNLYTEGRRQNTLEKKDIESILQAYNTDSDISRTVKINEIAKQEYIINPQRYIGIEKELENGVSLGDLCLSINRGAMIKSNDLDDLATTEETKYRYLMLQNIQNGVVDSNLPYLSNIEEKYLKYCINDKDLIISKISPFKTAMVNINDEEIVLANGNLYFIKLDETKVNPVFVQLFLQSELGMSQLNRLAKGAAMQTINVQDLRLMKIPSVSRDKQDLIVQEYEALNEELKILERQEDIILDKKSKLLDEVL